MKPSPAEFRYEHADDEDDEGGKPSRRVLDYVYLKAFEMNHTQSILTKRSPRSYSATGERCNRKCAISCKYLILQKTVENRIATLVVLVHPQFN
jgi:hypothetical protein